MTKMIPSFHFKTFRQTRWFSSLLIAASIFCSAVIHAYAADTTPPWVVITAPASTSTISGTIAIEATAYDNVTVAHVDFYIDGVFKSADNAAPYSYSWDTTLSGNGNHTLQATVYDAAGNTGESIVTIGVSNPGPDTIPPTAAITAPVPGNNNGSTFSGTVAFTASASDNIGITHVDFYVDGVLKFADAAAPYTYSWDTTLSGNGNHTLMVKAYDAAGNMSPNTDQNILIVSVVNPAPDTTPPSIVLIPPMLGVYWSGTVTMPLSSVSDNVGVTRIEFYANNVLVGSNTTSPYRINWDTTKVADGNYDITAKAYDAAGNIGTAQWGTASIDNTAPTISITAPANGASIAGLVTISATGSDGGALSSISFYDNGVFITSVSEGLFVKSDSPAIPWDSTKIANGAHVLTVNASDRAGHTATSNSITVNVNNAVPDTTPPTVSITAPSNGSSVSGLVTISATASDNTGVAHVDFYIDGALKLTDTAAPYSYSWDSSISTTVFHSIQAKAYDASGNSALSSISVAVPDTTQPMVNLLSPISGDVIKGIVTISARAADNYFYIARAEYYVDGVFKSAATLGAPVPGYIDFKPVQFFPITAAWDTTALANGPHTVMIEAYDTANNSERVLSNITVNNPVADTMPPTVDSISIEEMMTAVFPPPSSQSFSITATASDNVGVSRVEFYVDNALINSATSSPYGCFWSSANAANGIHTVLVRAYDAAGNIGIATATITVANPAPDTTPPNITQVDIKQITSATDPILLGQVEVDVAAVDNVGVTHVDFYLDNQLKFSDASSPYSWVWNSSNTVNGLHTVLIKAYDFSGNIGIATATITVANPVPDTTPPTVQLPRPTIPLFYSGVASIPITASDNVGVTKTELYDDNSALIGSDASLPYSISWDTTKVADGLHTLTAKAYDDAGNVGSTTGSLYVDNTAPSVTITSPANGASVSGQVDILANATDNLALSAYGFYDNGTLIAAFPETGFYVKAQSPRSPWDTTKATNGSHVLTIKVFDSAGNATISNGVTVTVNNTVPDTTPPIVNSITIDQIKIAAAFPPIFPGLFNISATASDNVGVTHVDFYIDNTLVSADPSSPYGCTWNSANAANGVHSLLVKAYDAAGNSGSATKTFTVSNPSPDTTPPTVSITAPTNGAILVSGKKYSLTAAASDNMGVVGVQFQLDGVNIGEELQSSPYTFMWDTTLAPLGFHNLTSVARDASGNKMSANIHIKIFSVIVQTIDSSGASVGNIRTTGFVVNVLNNAVSGPATLTIQQTDSSAANAQFSQSAAEQNQQLTLVGNGVSIQLTSTDQSTAAQLLKPMTITLAYQLSEVPEGMTVGLFYWDSQRNKWQSIPGSRINTHDNTVTAESSPLTTYAIFAVPKLNTDGIASLFAYPNPATGNKVTIHIETNTADKTTISLYNLAGQLLRELDITGTASLGINGQQSYEYALDISSLGSGTYLYAVQTQSAGQSHHKLGKFAVVK